MNSYLILPSSLIVVVANRQYALDNTHPSYTKVVDAIKAGDWESIPDLVDVGNYIAKNGHGKITVGDGIVLYNGQPLHNTLTYRLLDMLSDGFNVDPMIALLENLMANPTKTAIDEFYLFIETNRLPITEDGCILAYKRVDENFYDCYTHSVFNKPYSIMSIAEAGHGPWEAGSVTTEVVDGYTVVSMPVEEVDADRTRECSVGLHFCSLAYLGSFYSGTGHIIIVKINPRDIVAIPQDYNNTKGRCWKYTVIGCLETDESNNVTEEAYNTSVVSADVDFEVHRSYDEGYQDGRNRRERANVNGWYGEYVTAYDQGYKDGRGKQKRKFPRLV